MKEKSQTSEVLRTLAIILSQLDFEKKIKGTTDAELVRAVSGTIKDLKQKDNIPFLEDISYLIEQEGRFSEARSKLLELSYKLLE
ncbi:conserved hypothetical rRNA adenine N-6-methyltransferase [Sulfolobus islandicus Y.G.57.14]|uniref:Conserved hypothetical rRNA adenine N-6-methyltransferase n=1 Tax=Saccharolobus islandicus (strain Y.G.57.14 / Yellowstone \|nr:hypothetical protein [Sulfolobus islandicus]ACP44928.1 conserved hypothetical rRNA adenine N-6-methyltransferase [Sulfolobus islandicus Y.G.57.14]